MCVVFVCVLVAIFLIRAKIGDECWGGKVGLWNDLGSCDQLRQLHPEILDLPVELGVHSREARVVDGIVRIPSRSCRAVDGIVPGAGCVQNGTETNCLAFEQTHRLPGVRLPVGLGVDATSRLEGVPRFLPFRHFAVPFVEFWRGNAATARASHTSYAHRTAQAPRPCCSGLAVVTVCCDAPGGFSHLTLVAPWALESIEPIGAVDAIDAIAAVPAYLSDRSSIAGTSGATTVASGASVSLETLRAVETVVTEGTSGTVCVVGVATVTTWTLGPSGAGDTIVASLASSTAGAFRAGGAPLSGGTIGTIGTPSSVWSGSSIWPLCSDRSDVSINTVAAVLTRSSLGTVRAVTAVLAGDAIGAVYTRVPSRTPGAGFGVIIARVAHPTITALRAHAALRTRGSVFTIAIGKT